MFSVCDCDHFFRHLSGYSKMKAVYVLDGKVGKRVGRMYKQMTITYIQQFLD